MDRTPPLGPQLPSSMTRKLTHQAGDGRGRPQASARAAQAVVRAVRWYDATRPAVELGAPRGVQLPPGHVLVDLLVTAAPEVRCVALDEGIDRVARTPPRHQEGTTP
ncbi:hypothetical protein ACFYXF_31460 [Streptomyces sp. NPDC002680]|uniref:hypothetical protein n=1 Tax=Streptomyces sp. NPDC002680 TaxID=3364659 RepID=UPI0036981F8E